LDVSFYDWNCQSDCATNAVLFALTVHQRQIAPPKVIVAAATTPASVFVYGFASSLNTFGQRGGQVCAKCVRCALDFYGLARLTPDRDGNENISLFGVIEIIKRAILMTRKKLQSLQDHAPDEVQAIGNRVA
jgi:hypothetical protein